MLLILKRVMLTENSTIGELYIGGELECYTLELPTKDGLPGSAIPPGVFPVTLSPSPKFEVSSDPWVEIYAKSIPHINNIPMRSNILIHWGNRPDDTDGCVLVGKMMNTDFIGMSRPAFADLHAKILQDIELGNAVALDVRAAL